MKIRKKGAILVLGCVLVLAQMPMGALADTDDRTYADFVSGVPDETEREYITVTVSTEQELWEVAENCALDTWSLDKKVELKNNIELREHTNLAIPSFGGIFEGNGHKISGLCIEGGGSVQGLFRYVRVSGEVHDLKVQGRVAPAGTGSRSGGIAGVNYGLISNCRFSGTVEGDSEVGGITGVNESTGVIRNCESNAAVLGNHSTGGIAGSNHGTVKGCTNSGSVNIEKPDVAMDLENLSVEEMERLSSTENMAAHTDSGGIAGISDGSVMDCVNSGEIGYSHVGYNTGGIVGRLHQGYLENCTNKGQVQGRKDVGGIVGQLEPFIQVEYLEDRLQELDRETTTFMNLTERAKDSVSAYGSQAADVLNELSENLQGVESGRDSVKNAASDLKGIYESDAEDEEQKTEAVDALNKSLNGAGDNLEQLIDILENGADSADQNVSALLSQARVLQGTMEGLRGDLENFEGFQIQDASDEPVDAYYDTDIIQKGKVVNCQNLGAVEADANVGGIVGQIATEYDFDPEGDVEIDGEESLKANSSVKAVVRDSRNQGKVSGKKDYVGGIVGHAEFGAVIACESDGAISSSGGSYVGGIAGVCRGTIRSCSSQGEITGKNSVGGIVGFGCNVRDCYAYNTLSASGEKTGAVAGSLQEEGILSHNYFVDNGIGAVDGISYTEGAEQLSYQDFCLLEGVPQTFSGFQVTFLADGRELSRVECVYGDSISGKQIPEIPDKDGFYGVWPEFDFSCVTRGAALEADYEKWIGSLAGAEEDESGRSRLLVEGEFLPGAELTVSKSEGSYSFAITQPLLERGIVNTDQRVAYERPVTVRLLCDDVNSIVVEVEKEGNYIAADARVMGSYLLFDMEKPGSFRVTETQNYSWVIPVVAGVALLALILVAILLVRRRKKRKKAVLKS